LNGNGTGNAGATVDASVATANVGAGANLATTPWDYSIKNGTLFLNDANTRANVTWDATGTVATLTFNAPLTADRTNQARYQVGLVVTSLTDRIVDKDNNQLGLDQTGSQNSYPNKLYHLIHGTVKQPDLSLNLPTGNNVAVNSTVRWLATHQDAARFAVKVDSQDPTLSSVSYTKNINISSRFELTFNEPIATYNGRTGGHVGSAIKTGAVLSTISFAASDRTGGTANVDLKNNSSLYYLDPNGAAAHLFGFNTGDIERQFYLSKSAGTGDFGSATGTLEVANDASIVAYGTDIRTAEGVALNAGKYLLAVNPSNAKTLFVYIVGRTSIFDPKIVELKARVEGLPDPAGNTIKSADADKNQVTTSIQ